MSVEFMQTGKGINIIVNYKCILAIAFHKIWRKSMFFLSLRHNIADMQPSLYWKNVPRKQSLSVILNMNVIAIGIKNVNEAFIVDMEWIPKVI